MTITFNCEICGKSLTTTDDKAGRMAKCPGCGEMFTVPMSDAATGSVVAPVVEKTAAAMTGETMPCPMCGETISAASEKCEFCGEPLITAGGQGLPRIIEFGDIFETTWNRFKAKMGMAVVGNLLAMIISVISLIPTFGVAFGIVIMAEQSGREPEPLHFLWVIPTIVMAFGVMLFLGPGMTLLYLKIAREEDVDIGTIFSGGRFFVKFTVCSFLFGMMVGVGLLAFIIPGIILALRYWPFQFVIVDEDPPGLKCFSRAAELTQGNWGAVLLIGIAGVFINMVVGGACYILQLFTQPFHSLLFATSYVKMTGKGR